MESDRNLKIEEGLSLNDFMIKDPESKNRIMAILDAIKLVSKKIGDSRIAAVIMSVCVVSFMIFSFINWALDDDFSIDNRYFEYFLACFCYIAPSPINVALFGKRKKAQIVDELQPYE